MELNRVPSYGSVRSVTSSVSFGGLATAALMPRRGPRSLLPTPAGTAAPSVYSRSSASMIAPHGRTTIPRNWKGHVVFIDGDKDRSAVERELKHLEAVHLALPTTIDCTLPLPSASLPLPPQSRLKPIPPKLLFSVSSFFFLNFGALFNRCPFRAFFLCPSPPALLCRKRGSALPCCPGACATLSSLMELW